MSMPMKPFGNLPYESLSGAQKAATILLVLDREDKAVPILQRLEESEITAVTRTMASAGRLSNELVEAVCKEFMLKFEGGDVSVGSVNAAQRMLSRFLPPERVEAIMSEIAGPIGRTTWEKLANVNPDALAKFFEAESDETAAVVLSRLRPDVAARIMESFPTEKTLSVVECMIGLDTVPNDTIAEIEEVLKTELMANFTKGQGSAGFDEILAEIFNRTNRDTLSVIFEEVGKKKPEEIENIKAKMFTFEDLGKIDTDDLLTLLSEIDLNIIARSLKNVDESLREVFFRALPGRKSEMLRTQYEMLGRVRLREAQEAQTMVLEEAKRMEAAGLFRLKADSEEDKLIG